MSSDNLQPVLGINRRELLKRGGKVAAAAAISSVFSPFVFTGKAAPTKTLSFWQFYAPARQVGTQSKWFEDCVKGWNATHDVKVELQYVPVQDYIGGSKLQTAFAAGQGPDIFIISPGDFLRYYNGGVLVDLTPYMEDPAKKDFFPSVMETRIVVSPRKSALEKATTEGGYSSAPMKLFKDLTLLTGRSEPRVTPEVYKAVSDTIQACQLSGADPKQAAEEGSQRIESFLSEYTGAPLL